MAGTGNRTDGPIEERLVEEMDKGLLRFMICGSIGDGKCTLLDRLLHDAGVLYSDQLADFKSDSRQLGATGAAPDYALLPAGQEAERERMTTMDVAYRYFSTPRRKFIVTDVSQRERLADSLVAAASDMDYAVLLVDAEKGLMPQTKRHAYILSRLGVDEILIAVNKMDHVDYQQEAYDRVVEDFVGFAEHMQVGNIRTMPLSALLGDNVIHPSDHMPWYRGPTFLEFLETVDLRQRSNRPFRMLVEHVDSLDQDSRVYAGPIEQGTVRSGDRIVVLPSGQETEVARIVFDNADLEEAVSGQAVTLILQKETDVNKGDVISAADNPPEQADQFAVHLVWFGPEPLYPGRPYHVKIGNRTLTGQVTELKHKIDVTSLEKLACRHLDMNDIAYATLSLDQSIPFEPYHQCRALGSFLLADRFSDVTVGYGTIDFALWRATTVPWQALEITKAARAELTRQKPVILWFTGLSGAGKSTIANLVAKRLQAAGRLSYLLDGDNVRHGLNRDLGFRQEDRIENIRRVGEVSKLFVDAGLIVLVSLISPFGNERAMVREMVEPDEFIEIYVEASLEECEQRDPKGLYARARAGEIRNFTGIDSPYEPPETPEIVLNTVDTLPEELADKVIAFLEERGEAHARQCRS